jgi:divalent metal cation (Fe/Co/Zn/Cd) transporter
VAYAPDTRIGVHLGMATRARTREQAVRRARGLNRLTIGYNVVEMVVALAAGVVAGSISLIGFGLDSGVEVSTSLVLAWRLSREGRDGCRQDDDRRATKLIAACFWALALWVGYEAVGQLAAQEGPDASPVGMVIAALSLVLMPILARAKRKLGAPLGSQAVVSEARQTELCAWLSGVVLLGLAANAWLGWWWADPVAAIGVSVIAGLEGWRSWRADALEDTCCT